MVYWMRMGANVFGLIVLGAIGFGGFAVAFGLIE